MLAMCGRYSFYVDDYEKFYNEFEITNRLENLQPHYNIAPGMSVSVITKNSPKKVELMKWGLIPFWSKDPRIGYKMINARAEGIETKPSFRKPLRFQRCLVPTSGFYEWKHLGEEKQPYYIKLKDRDMFAFAGLYDIWKDAEGYELKSFTIITTTPNSIMEEIHNRMPVILDDKFVEVWLDNTITDIKVLLDLLKPSDSKGMMVYPVSKLVNSPRNDNVELIKPLG